MKFIATTTFLLLLTVGAQAATWHVAKDGTGDFAVIQDAIDAAGDGDTIWIHAGRYEELTEQWDVWGDGSSYADCHIVVTKDNLTLRGDGPIQTTIGESSFPSSPDYNLTGINVTYNEASRLTIRDLAIENVNWGVYGASPEIEITNCRFEGNEIAASWLKSETQSIVNGCRFIDCQDSIVAVPPCSSLEVFDSEFTDCIRGVVVLGPTQTTVDGCQFNGMFANIEFEQGGTGIVRNCDFASYLVSAVSLSLGGYAEIRDCSIDGGLRGIYSSNSAGGQGFRCYDSVFRNQADHAFYINGGVAVVNNCEIYNGGGWSVYCRSTVDCATDMTNNYWGTDSEAQIAEWIHDQNDDPELCCDVDFIPFSGIVATERHSWSAVKSLFESAGGE